MTAKQLKQWALDMDFGSDWSLPTSKRDAIFVMPISIGQALGIADTYRAVRVGPNDFAVIVEGMNS